MCGAPLPWWIEEMEKDKEQQQLLLMKQKNVIDHILKAHIKTKRSPLVKTFGLLLLYNKQTIISKILLWQ